MRTGDTTSAGTLVKDWNTQTIVRDVQAQAVITQEFTQRSKESAASYFADARDALTKKASETDDPKELASIQQQAKDLNQQERVVGVVISLLGNPASSMLVGNALSEAAQSMRNSTIENSSIFAGVTDGTTVLDNISGPSEGINGDNKKTGGVRVDLNLLCGKDNGRCVTDTDGSLQLNAQGLAQFDRAAAGMNLAEFLQTPDGLKMSGPTGGIQGSVGTLFGIPYAPGSWQDKLIESFGGPHDFIGGYLSGLYDAQGNIKQNMTEAERFIYDNFVTTAAIPAAVPFALMQAVPPQIWQNALILIQGMKAAK